VGGKSRSRVSASAAGASFEGELVTAGGGFASVRCILDGLSRMLAGASGVVLRTNGSDGRSGYKITAKTDQVRAIGGGSSRFYKTAHTHKLTRQCSRHAGD
jgi:hypothetical protein